MAGRLALAAGLAGLCGLGCAPVPGAAWRAAHPDFVRAAPAAEAAVAPVVASLVEQAGSRRVAVSQIRWLGLESDPWRELPGEEALLAEAAGEGLHAVVAGRTCRQRSGLRRFEVSRGSWLLFQGGRLAAFDHWEFGDECVPEHRFLPTPAAQRALEVDLSREVARRFPENALDPEQTFRKGLVYAEHQRREDAAAMLALGDRALAELLRAAREAEREDPDAEPPAVGEARRLRAELSEALRDPNQPEDPEDRFWQGY